MLDKPASMATAIDRNPGRRGAGTRLLWADASVDGVLVTTVAIGAV